MITIQLFAELNDFLDEELRSKAIRHQLDHPRSVKDLLESIGVPHSEIDAIIVGEESVDFSYLVGPGDDIAVYPVSLQPRGLHLVRLQKIPPDTRFILDVHLGKLASYMRMMGFDTLYRNDYDDPELARISADEDRILLTCDRQLLMRRQVEFGYFVRSREPGRQFSEVMRRYQLEDRYQPFSRCIECNGIIQPVEKDSIASQLEEKTRQYYDDFYQCRQCHKIYWEGNHVRQMQSVIDELVSEHATQHYDER